MFIGVFVFFQSLQSHFHHTITMEANKFSHKLNQREIDLGPLLETTIGDVCQLELILIKLLSLS